MKPHQMNPLENKMFRGRIISQHHQQYLALPENREEPVLAMLSGKMAFAAKKTLDYPAVGDWVRLDRDTDDAGDAVIIDLESRTSLLRRTEAGTGGNSQSIAANVDILFICMSLNHDYNRRRLERYLAVAYGCGIRPVVVLTKSDLEEAKENFMLDIMSAQPGLEILLCSNLTGEGLNQIRELIDGKRTVAFVGSSGVGKSTIINSLLGKDVLKTAGIRESDGRGRHTTTHRELFPLEGGGAVIDSPGIRELALDDSDVDEVFEDITDLELECRFNDCTHGNEPGCALKQAIRDGRLDPKRFNSYMKLKAEEEARILRKTTKKFVPLVYNKW
jgi:ribosome biogenesis GTPase / thiamine phosphate phosphatase